MGPRTSIGDMVDNHVKEKGLPPLEDEFLDALSLGDLIEIRMDVWVVEGVGLENQSIESTKGSNPSPSMSGVIS